MSLKAQATVLTMIRQKLGTWPQEVGTEGWLDPDVVSKVQSARLSLDSLVSPIKGFGELFLGMANGPFLLVLKADNANGFIQYAERRPSHEVTIGLLKQDGQSGAPDYQLEIRAASEPQAYRLVAGLPRLFYNQVLQDENRGIRLGPGIKKRFFSEITVYRMLGDRDIIYRLHYTPTGRRHS